MRERSIGWVALLLLWVPCASAAQVHVARPSLPLSGASAVDTRGTVFFLKLADGRNVAVGTAHTFPLRDIARAGRTDFYTGLSFKKVGSSTRFLAEPGKPFSLPGATLRDDYLVYALDGPLQNVKLLEADANPPKQGERVSLIGIPEKGKHEEDNVFGTVAVSTPERLEIDLDLAGTLRGWGGAPVLRVANGKAIGMVLAQVSQNGTARIFAAPIGGALAATAKPLEGGKGSAFARFEAKAAAQPATAAPVPAANPNRGGAARPMLAQNAGEPTSVQVDFEYPPPGAVVGGSACGVFVAGGAQASNGEARQFDVVMVIDTSRSTIDPTGADINGNGVIGRNRLGSFGSVFGTGSTDPGDSILAAEVAGARTLLHGLDERTTRAGLVTFAGDDNSSRRSQSAYTMVALTGEFDRVEKGLDEVLATEPEGSTHMAAGVDQATIELAGLRGAVSRPRTGAEKVVFFFTDGQPTMPYGPENEADNVRAVLRAANRAHRAGVRINSFAVGPDALEGPIATVEMASRTDGYFTPVRKPGDLTSAVENVNIANLDQVDLTNRTTKQGARYFRATADGSWAGFIDMADGMNKLNVKAKADDGATGESDADVKYQKDAESPPVPKHLAARRNRLLEECLLDLKRRRLDAEHQKVDQLRRELQIEIEKEREKAKQSSDAQRKELDLEAVGKDEVEEPAGKSPTKAPSPTPNAPAPKP